MAGKAMKSQRSGRPVTVGDLEIEPIERVVVHLEHVWGGIIGIALKEPIAVVIRTPTRTWRVDLELDSTLGQARTWV
jgi:hypothetical protein